ncbi:MAG: dTDP-4-dehydrorhamnose 3,5-epimerase [Alcaligenaceae bacterium]|nr:MAG: dTDP-4-dehydrorhamnose 3,5-epimerase [Alcaligenaceae bacterium]
MIISETRIQGVFVVDLERRADDRGYFARTFCEEEFDRHGLESRFVQCNSSFNVRRGTLRGMHYQAEPFPEIKLVRCTRGTIFDVAVDLRPDSPTFKAWVGVELSHDNSRALYVPAGCAHGFQTLTSDAEVLYMMGETYRNELACGVRWNDPAFAIDWPIDLPFLSERDATYPDYAQ